MTSRMGLRMATAIMAILLAPAAGYTQEATLSGTVIDSGGGVLPGVSVTATHTASGNTFLAVTDAAGAFRLPLRTGAFRITAELPGFGTVARTLELLVGQQAVVNLQMAPAAVQETVTVTGEAPLINTVSSTVAGNVDPRQLQELPVNGRQWLGLGLLAPGNRENAVGDVPTERIVPGGAYQINIDGLQNTHLTNFSTGNPQFSRDAIAEFQFVANRFDASQGRSIGVQINAVTKSGTNNFAGTFAGYFRDDKFNAADTVVNRVLPYSDRQMSTTFGGPIRKDRVHFFSSLEVEREPRTSVFNTPYPRFNADLSSTRKSYTGGGRMDVQFTPRTRLAVRVNKARNRTPVSSAGSSTSAFNSALEESQGMREVFGTLTQVLSPRVVNELKVGYAFSYFDRQPTPHWTAPSTLQLPEGLDPNRGAPRILLRSFTIGPGNQFLPQAFFQTTYSLHDNLTFSYAAGGRHDLKLGGEYLHYPIKNVLGNNIPGELQANVAPIPANIENLFPDPMNADTWNLQPLSPIAIAWRQAFGDFLLKNPRYVAAAWVQDDWTVTPRLTLNLGLRYDLQLNVFTNDSEVLPFMPGGRPNDLNNFGPRIGAVYSVNDRTVIRGGFGKYFGEIPTNASFYSRVVTQTVLAEIVNDGRPDFASNPFNGPTPTFGQIKQTICTPANPLAPNCIRRAAANGLPSAEMVIPYSYQGSAGFQRQLGATMAITGDYVYNGARKLPVIRNVNLTYNPATGANYPFRDISRRPYPDWGSVGMLLPEVRANTHALDTSFTKRFSQGWQFAATYSLAGKWDESASMFPGVENLPPDLAGEYGLAVGDQRHRAVFNGVWEVGWGFQVSGLYFYGSGQRFATSWGPDLRDAGVVSSGTAVAVGLGRLRPNGTIVPRNNFVGKPLHRVDLRLQERVPLRGRKSIDAVLEIFNLFNHENFGSYTTQESSRSYGQPVVNSNVAYGPRALQLGFRVAF